MLYWNSGFFGRRSRAWRGSRRGRLRSSLPIGSGGRRWRRIGRRRKVFGYRCFGLTAEDGVDVDAREARAGRLNRRGGLSRCQRRLQLVGDVVQKVGHMVDGADAEVRHAAVGDAAMRSDLEPVDSAVAKADAVDVAGLGDDDVVRLILAEPALLREVRDAGKSAALLVDAAALLHRSAQADAGAANRFDGEDGSRRCRPSGRRCRDRRACRRGSSRRRDRRSSRRLRERHRSGR